jgi:Ulp1 family protease
MSVEIELSDSNFLRLCFCFILFFLFCRLQSTRSEDNAGEFTTRKVRSSEIHEERAKEAKARASTLLRPLTCEEQEIVNEAIRGSESIRTCENDSIQRQSLHKLSPGVWLNDEVIHSFFLMLAKRDERLCRMGRKRSHFFKSFFMTKLLGGSSENYKYANVKRWSKNVPGKDIFNLSKIFFPVNIMNQHWSCAVIFMEDKRIQFFDSMHGTGIRYLRGLFQYLKDEHQAKKGCPLPDEEQWQLVCCTNDIPVQSNGKHIMVFNYFLVALFLSDPLVTNARLCGFGDILCITRE